MIKKDAYKPNLFLKTSDNLTVIAQSIIALSESLLKEKSLNNNLGRRRQILMLKESALNMRELVADIQELSLLETGEKSYQLEHFHLHEIFKVIVPLVYGIIGDKAIKFNLAIQDDLPMVYADRRKIREVVMNFLENAVCFTDLGNITLKASTEQNMVKISIQDTGVGIRPEEIRAIFRGFKTTGGSIPLEYEGSGLRLNINKRIIESHGGKIGVKSKVGEGTTFYFTLRARPFEEVTPSTDLETNSDEYNLMEPETSSPESSKDDYQFTGPVSDTDRMIQIGENELIMVVDDSPTSREMIASILTDYNYQAITAANGKEALDKILQNKPHLVITELFLPFLNGFELCKILKRQFDSHSIPIIIISSRRIIDDTIYSLNIGVDDYITKPFNRYELLARVSALLRMYKLQRQLQLWNEKLEDKVAHRTRQLSEMQKQLIQSEKMSSLGNLTAGVAHEINNPLAYVCANVDLLRNKFALMARKITLDQAWLNWLAASCEKEKKEAVDEFILQMEKWDKYKQDVLDFQAESETQADRLKLFPEFHHYIQESEQTELDQDIYQFMDSTGHFILRCEEGLERVKKIISDLRDFSRLGKEEWIEADVCEIVDKVLTLSNNLLEQKNIKVIFTRKGTKHLQCFPDRLNQVFLNIVINAVQAMDKGGRLQISTFGDDQNIQIQFQDNGRGIPENIKTKVFDPFFTTKPVGVGTGLGLSISYQIISSHQGKISLHNLKEGGTLIKIVLPCRQPKDITKSKGKSSPENIIIDRGRVFY